MSKGLAVLALLAIAGVPWYLMGGMSALMGAAAFWAVWTIITVLGGWRG